MRRPEFEVTDPVAVQSFLDECDFGVLSLLSDGAPYGVAVNFAYRDGRFYFHGSPEGRKAEAIGARSSCSFTVIKAFAYIPSYFSGTRSACPASQYFASVVASGHAVRLDEPARKARALGALMEKMQPEGGYDPIDAADPRYAKMLEKTGVYAIEPDSLTFKVKAGQHLSPERRDALVERLRERHAPADPETVATIQQMTRKEPS